jgi:hypothetical protein
VRGERKSPLLDFVFFSDFGRSILFGNKPAGIINLPE